MGIKVEYLGNYNWRILEDLVFLDVTVPAGFIFDGASTPRLLWSILPPMQDTAEAAAIHDWMCRYAKNREERKKADRYFSSVLFAKSRVGFIRVTLGYLGTRLGAFLGIGVNYKHWRKRNELPIL